MASPFRAFRKYQKALLVVAGVVLIFVFVVGDSLMQMVGGTMSGSGHPKGRGPGDIAVRWDGGSLTNQEVFLLAQQRAIVNSFVREVEAVGQYQALQLGAEPQPLAVPRLIGPERLQDGVERDVVYTRIFANAARKMGMTVSDEYIVEYLRQLGRGYVTVDIVRQILGNMQFGGRPLSDAFILDALREEMLSRNYLQSYFFARTTLIPEQRWQDWLKVNDRVVVEAAAIPTESFVVDVADPTDAELAAFFEQYKNREPQPEIAAGVEFPSPTPGFARPRKVGLQYLRADFNKYLDKVKSEITDAEIEKFYEDNKDPYFVESDSILMESDVPPATDGADAKADDNSDAKAAGESTPEDDAKAAPQDNDQSSRDAVDRQDVFRLVAFQQEEEKATETPPAAETPAAAAEGPASGLQIGDQFPTDGTATTEAPKKFQPLDEVRDEIRRQIAEVKVSDQLEKLMTDVQRELDEKYMAYIGAVFDAEATEKPAPPPPADLADLTPLAEKYGLKFHQVEPLSILGMRDLPIGRSAQSAAGNVPLIYAIFGRELELYQPVSTYDLDANRYITMKTSDTPGSVPELSEIRDEVVQAYKLQKAADLALVRAKNDAKELQASGASFEQFFADDKSVQVVKTDPFAYLTIGNISRDTQQVQSFRLSNPKEIVAAGPEFMQTVFNLGEGEVAAVLNHDHSLAYVVRIAEHENKPAELQQAFLEEADNWYGLPAMAQLRAQAATQALVAELIDTSGIKWERDPDVAFREAAEADDT